MTYAFDSENDIDCRSIRQGIGASIDGVPWNWEPTND